MAPETVLTGKNAGPPPEIVGARQHALVTIEQLRAGGSGHPRAVSAVGGLPSSSPAMLCPPMPLRCLIVDDNAKFLETARFLLDQARRFAYVRRMLDRFPHEALAALELPRSAVRGRPRS